MEKLFLDVSTYLHTSKNHVCLLRTKTTTYDTYASVYTFSQLVKVKVIGMLFGDFQTVFLHHCTHFGQDTKRNIFHLQSS